MDFDRDWNNDVAAGRQQAQDPELAAMAARVRGAPHQPGTMHTVTPDANGVVVLPAGTDINQIAVSGRNLVVSLPDGTQLVILEGAVAVPRLVVGDVEIPSVNLAALLIGEEPQPAAGPPRSSGGNFLADDCAIGDPFGLGDLLPPTELQFTQPEEREILPIAPEEDNPLTISVIGDGGPLTVDDSALGVGSTQGFGGAFTTSGVGTVTYSLTATAGASGLVDTITGEAVNLVQNGAVVEGRTAGSNLLVFTLSVDSAGNVTLDQSRAVVHSDTSNPNDSVTLSAADLVTLTATITNSSGQQQSAALNIGQNLQFLDDAPQAVDDVGGTLTEDVAGSLSGNVLTNDVAGADTPKSFVAWGADAAAVAELNSYGTLTQNSDGSWSYVLDNSRAATQALGSGFSKDFTLNYSMQDADGDPSPASLTITVKGAADGASVVTAAATGPDATVHEAGLPSGTANDGSHVTMGSFTVSATDGIANIVVGGVVFTLAQMQAFGTTNGVVNTGEGTLRLTGYNAGTGAVSYSYTLSATIDNDSKPGATLTEFDDSVALSVNGISGTTASDTLIVRILDDAPQAVNDVDSVTEGLGNKADGNVFTGAGGTDANATDGVADTIGADGAVVGGAVSGARLGTEAGGGALTAVGAAGATISGTYGDLLIKADGSYVYTLKTASIPAGVASETFTYQVTDGDGDTDLAQLVISLNQDARVPDVTGDTSTVYEDGLADGLQHGAASETDTTGQFTVNANGESYTLTLDGDLNPAQTITAVGQQVVTSKGVLTITSISAPDVNGTVTYGYSYTLSQALTHSSQGEVNPLTDTISMTVTDATGDSDATPGSIVISIVDDIPTSFAPISTTLTNAAGQSATRGLDVDSNINNNVGADQPGTLTFANIVNGQDTALNSGGAMIELWLSNGGTTLQGRTGSTNGTDGTLIYTVQLNQNLGIYTTTIHQAIDNGSGAFFNDLSGGVAGNPPFKLVGSTSADNLEILFTPISNQASPSVNSDSDDIGVDGQFIDITNPDAGLRLDFGDFTYDANGGGTSDDAFVMVNHQTVNGFKFTIDQISNGTTADVRLKAVDANEDGNVEQQEPNTADDTTLAITMVKIYNAAGTLIDTVTADKNVAGGIVVDFEASGTVLITGLSAQYKVQTYTASGYDRIEITNAGTSGGTDGKFSLSQLQVETTQTGNPVNLNFDLSLTDADGDQVIVNDAINLTLVPPIALDLDGDGVEYLGLSAGVSHDYFGTGAVATAWVAADDGLLAFRNPDGSLKIVFSTQAGETDLQGLAKVYDSHQDGMLDASDADFASFGVWQDANSDGIVQDGEFRTLSEAKIVSLNLTSDGQAGEAAGGDVQIFGQTSYTTTNGETYAAADVAFQTEASGGETEQAEAERTQQTGFNQVLIAASLVAVVGAAEAVEQEPVTASSAGEASAEPAVQASATVEISPITDEDAPAASLGLTQDQDDGSANDPAQQSTHGGEAAPDHSSLSAGEDMSAGAPSDASDAPPADFDSHDALLAQPIDLPVFDGNAAVLAAAHDIAPHEVAQVVADALGAQDVPDIDTLLAALPGGEHPIALAMFSPVAVEPVDMGHMAAAAAVFDAAMAAHDAMAVAHA